MGLFRILKQIFAPVFSPGTNPSRDASQAQSTQPSSVDHRDLTPPDASPRVTAGEASQPVATTNARSASNQRHSGSPNAESQMSGFGGLDASQFQPLTNDEAMAATDQPGWQTAYWDPLHVIPSSALPRIRVIDQTMVGMGLIDAEELAEIHRLGNEMSKFRTDYHAVQDAGNQAVEQSRDAREARKAEMKRLAAERKQVHLEAVAHRKATDIVFLGRGVSRGLADRRSNIERLKSSDLPVLSSPADVATAMGISVPTLRWLAFHHPASKTTHYHTWAIAKRSGGERMISRPQRKLATAQQWILDSVLSQISVHESAHGFVPGRSTLTGAEPHVRSKVVINMDLQNFFPTIDFARIAGLFRGMGYSPAVATIFALLCTESPRRIIRSGKEVLHAAVGNRSLPQGACTSPALSNLISHRMDKRLAGIATKLGWRYTRYADDMTFSTQGDDTKIGYVLARVRHVAQEEGFTVKESKTRVLRQSTQQTVTGIVVNDRPSIDRKTIRQLRSILHRAKFEGLEKQNRIGHPNFACWVQGMIAYINMVNPQQGAKLRNQLDSLQSD